MDNNMTKTKWFPTQDQNKYCMPKIKLTSTNIPIILFKWDVEMSTVENKYKLYDQWVSFFLLTKVFRH